MQKVISINLNGNAYQLDESGYDTLRAYLAEAARQLEANPDRAEIMADLEQAIADRCGACLGPHKSVVSASEVDRIVAEMGPVDGTAGESSSQAGRAATGKATDEKREVPPRRLYRIPAGAMIAGVCNGIASHLRIDVTIVRIAFVIATLLTKGAAIIAYVVMMFVIPEANTAEARAAVVGTPLNAKEVLDRAKKQYAAGTTRWRRQWRQQQRQWRRHGWPGATPAIYGPPPWAAVLLPVFGLLHVALFLAMATMMISLVNTGAILDWHLPDDVPLWAGALILLIAYQVAVSPLRAFQHWSLIPRPGLEPGWFAFWNAVTGLLGLALVVWIASNHMPEIREFLQHVPELIRDFVDAMRDLIDR
jgi:phage shock protein PspC (stress-responsive transcriptional regulator)